MGLLWRKQESVEIDFRSVRYSLFAEVEESKKEKIFSFFSKEKRGRDRESIKKRRSMPPASAVAVAAPAAGGDAPADAPAAQANPIFGLLRMLAIWWLFRAFFSGGGGKSGGPATATSTSQLARSDYFLPLMMRATPVDVAMVLSEEKDLAPGWFAFGEKGPAREGDAARVVWRQSDVPLAATSSSAESKVTVSYTPSEVI